MTLKIVPRSGRFTEGHDPSDNQGTCLVCTCPDASAKGAHFSALVMIFKTPHPLYLLTSFTFYGGKNINPLYIMTEYLETKILDLRLPFLVIENVVRTSIDSKNSYNRLIFKKVYQIQ